MIIELIIYCSFLWSMFSVAMARLHQQMRHIASTLTSRYLSNRSLTNNSFCLNHETTILHRQNGKSTTVSIYHHYHPYDHYRHVMKQYTITTTRMITITYITITIPTTHMITIAS